MANEISIREFLTRFEAGAYEMPDVSTQCEAGWYDWFCKPTSLRAKTRFLAKKVKQLAASKLVDQDNWYVFFKNNCPCDGSLYDSFSFCDRATGEVKFWICPATGHKGPHYGKPEVANFCVPGFNDMGFDSWRDVRKYFQV